MENYFFRLSAIYGEPKINFIIPHKIDEYLMKKMNEVLFPNDIFNKKYLGMSINFIVNTDSVTQELTIRKPLVSKRYKVVDFVVVIPHKAVCESENYLHTYFSFLEAGIKIVLERFELYSEKIALIFKEIKETIIYDEEYLSYDKRYEDFWESLDL
jgi:hypothetical protein